MGSGSSCYPTKDHRASIEHEPYDAKRLLSELITVQTAIVLSDEITDHKGDFRASDQPRKSIEYTITTSLTVPTVTISHGHQEARRDLSPSGLEFQGGALMDILTAHFKHRVDVVKCDNGIMPSIQEASEISTC
ncbi:uncharacterized protein LOC119736902 [Patiria miniata]|uniref:Uncharacterized protein n=1 Tax=Patiria miniata TaxID=46514 RepID=A0A914ASV8_PATMI|nr:uncharacterized protein LOC119736902 [Patiria miniata]